MKVIKYIDRNCSLQ